MRQVLYVVFFIVVLLSAYWWYNKMNESIDTMVNQYQQIYTLEVKHENDYFIHK